MKTKTLKISADFILYGISLANAFRLAWAYAYADAGGNWFSLPGAFGLGIGAMISLGVAYISGKIPGKMTDTRKRLGWAVLIVGLILETIIVSPLTLTDMPEKLRLTLGNLDWLWAVVLALTPSLILAGVAFASGNLVGDAKKPDEAALESGTQPAQPTAKPSKPIEAAGNVLCRNGCDHAPMTQDGENAHQRWCKKNPNRFPDGAIPVDMSTMKKDLRP